MTASEPVSDNEGDDLEKVIPERKLILVNLTEELQLFKTVFDFF